MYNKLQQIRKSKGISQESLADKAKISREYLSNIETGKVNPTLKVAFSVAHALGVKVGDIFFADNVISK